MAIKSGRHLSGSACPHCKHPRNYGWGGKQTHCERCKKPLKPVFPRAR